MQRINILTLSVAAAAAVVAETFGTLTGATASAAGNAQGVFRTDAASGEQVPLDCLGTAVVKAGGAFSAGDELEVGADGKAVVQSAGVTVARALEEATADGDRVEVFLIPN